MELWFQQQSPVEKLAMDEHEKQKGHIHITTHDDVNKTQDYICENIPLDLILEILSRLPVKSILRFRCVSKLWSSFTELQSFINLFASRYSTRPPTPFITLSANSKHLVLSFPQNQDQSKPYSPSYDYQVQYPFKFTIYHNVRGLILVDIFKIWNPSLRRFFTIPHPDDNKQNYKSCFLGYDPREGKHKLLCLLTCKNSSTPHVLTLGAQESWRKISKATNLHFPIKRNGRCFDGIIYYEARAAHASIQAISIIMSFDVRYETFNSIKIPNNFIKSFLAFHMIHYEGKLALVEFKDPYNKIDLYILKDTSGNEWTHLQFHWKSEWKITDSFSCMGITDDHQIIFAPTIYSRSLYILYFDPKKKSIRGTKIVNNKHPIECTYMNVFPNYI